MTAIKTRIITAILAFALLLAYPWGFIPPASAAVDAFADVPRTHWAYEAVSELSKIGLVNGIGSGNFGINDKLTIAQAITLIVRAYNYLRGTELDSTAKSGEHWAKNYINAAYNAGIIKNEPAIHGYWIYISGEQGADCGIFSDTFGSNNAYLGISIDEQCTRTQIAMFIDRLIGDTDVYVRYSGDDVNIDNLHGYEGAFRDVYNAWDNFQMTDDAIKSISHLYMLGLVTGYGDGTYGYADTLSRAEAAVLIYNYINTDFDNPAKPGARPEQYAATALPSEVIGVPDDMREAVGFFVDSEILKRDETGKFNLNKQITYMDLAVYLWKTRGLSSFENTRGGIFSNLDRLMYLYEEYEAGMDERITGWDSVPAYGRDPVRYYISCNSYATNPYALVSSKELLSNFKSDWSIWGKSSEFSINIDFRGETATLGEALTVLYNSFKRNSPDPRSSVKASVNKDTVNPVRRLVSSLPDTAAMQEMTAETKTSREALARKLAEMWAKENISADMTEAEKALSVIFALNYGNKSSGDKSGSADSGNIEDGAYAALFLNRNNRASLSRAVDLMCEASGLETWHAYSEKDKIHWSHIKIDGEAYSIDMRSGTQIWKGTESYYDILYGTFS
jgi:hypothetical protein